MCISRSADRKRWIFLVSRTSASLTINVTEGRKSGMESDKDTSISPVPPPLFVIIVVHAVQRKVLMSMKCNLAFSRCDIFNVWEI